MSRLGSGGLGRAVLGERLGGFLYGTILVLAVLVGGAKAHPDNAGKIAILVAVTTVVFWLAHVYAHSVARVVAQDRHVSFGEVRAIARHEGSLIEAAIPPIVPLLAGALGLISTRAAVWIAYGLGLGVLALQGFVFARIERLGWLGTATVVTANLALGVVLVGLKLVVSH
jgi:hypothetical protein